MEMVVEQVWALHQIERVDLVVMEIGQYLSHPVVGLPHDRNGWSI
jgi:hypothetical protein